MHLFQIPFSDTKSTLHILGGVSAQIEPAPQETTIYLYKIPVCRGCLVVLIKIADLVAELSGDLVGCVVLVFSSNNKGTG